MRGTTSPQHRRCRTLCRAALVLALALVAGPVSAQQAQGGGSAFALHAGAVYTRLPDVEFERVQALSGQDLFAPVNARESTADFGVFVSQRLWADPDGGTRVYATLGTGVSAPGSVLYLGGSVGVSRALVTLGLGTTLVPRGEQAVPDDVFRGGERTLFGAVERDREWAFLAAVSFALVH